MKTSVGEARGKSDETRRLTKMCSREKKGGVGGVGG